MTRNRSRVFALAVIFALMSLFAIQPPAKGASAGLSQVLSIASTNFSSPTNLIVGGDHVWVLSQSNKRIVKIDRFTGAVLGSTATMTDTPNKLAWDGSRIWVSFLSGGKIARVNQDLTVSVSGTVCTSPLFNDSVAAANGRVFVSCWNTSLLAELNPDTLAVSQSTAIGSMPFGLRANDTKVYVDTGNQVRIFTVGSLTTAPVVVNTGMPTHSAHQMTLDSDFFWMVGNNTGQTAKLGRLRLSDNSVTLYTVSTSTNASFNPIASDGRFVYLPNTTENAFASFDITAGTWEVEVANTSPTGVATTPGEVWAILSGSVRKYSTNVQSVTWNPSNVSNTLAASPITPNVQATSSGAGAISYAVASAGTAQCAVNSSTGVVSAVSVGTCTIRAIAAATANASSGFTDVVFTFSAQAQTVTWSPTNTSVAASSGSLTPDSLATSSGPGSITYSVQSAGGTGCQVNSTTGVLTFTTAGTCLVRATAAAGGGFGVGITDVSFTFTLQSQTVTWAPTNTSALVSAATLTPNSLATRSGAGTVSYAVQSAGTTGCTVNSSTAVISFTSAGSCTIRASVAASGGFSSAFTDVTFTFTLQSQTVTWAPTNTSAILPVVSITPNALASSSGPGLVSYAILSAGTTGCTVNQSSAVLSFSADGTCVVRATAAATATHSLAFVDVSFAIQPDPNQVSVNQLVSQPAAGLQVYGLSPRLVRLGDTPTIKLLSSVTNGSVTVTIGSFKFESQVAANGEVIFVLPNLPSGTYSIDYSFKGFAHLRMHDAVAVVERLPVKRAGIDVVSRMTILPTAIVGGSLSVEAKEAIARVSQNLGPVFSMKCTAYVSERNNTSSSRRAAFERAKSICEASSRATASGPYATEVKVLRQAKANILTVLVELLFKR